MEEYLHVFGRTGDNAVIIDSQQEIVYWNASAEKVLGYPEHEAVGKQCWDLFHGRSEDGEHICRPNCHIINKINRGETIGHFNLVVKNYAGNDVVINISTLNISQGDENPHPVLVQLSHEVDTGILGDGKLKIQLLGTTAVTRPEGSKVEGAQDAEQGTAFCAPTPTCPFARGRANSTYQQKLLTHSIFSQIENCLSWCIIWMESKTISTGDKHGRTNPKHKRRREWRRPGIHHVCPYPCP